MTVTDRTIYTDFYTDLKALLVAGTITGSPTITSADSDKTFTKPTISIHSLDKDETNVFFGTSEGIKILNIVIDCHANTAKKAEQAAQDVEYILKNNKIKGVVLSGIVSNYNKDIINNINMKYKSNTFTYKKR